MLKAPPRQNATDTIATLASRLSSATLLEDRRGAILGLRSFAKQYPASVAGNSLRDLIECLRSNTIGISKDAGEGDVDTIRSILETFKMLFEPDEDSPEASDEIRLFIADEFSQRQDNITILLELLEISDYYVRTHSLQLLSHVTAARLERTQECILSAPLGTARLVGILDDSRAAVRLDALNLLVDLTMVSQTELQKLIAFEDAFARIFALIREDGGILEGARIVEQSLGLLANLVRHSTSNQSLFRESGCVKDLKAVVSQIMRIDTNTGNSDNERAGWGVLAVLRLFLERGELGTKANQVAFARAGIDTVILDIAFRPEVPSPIASMALLTCSDMIHDNHALQEDLPKHPVTVTHPPETGLTNGHVPKATTAQVDAISALLEVVYGPIDRDDPGYRHSACAVLKSYLYNSPGIRHHFLGRAIHGYKSGEEPHENLLCTLMSGPPKGPGSDVVRYVYASEILTLLVAEDDDAKTMLLDISEGNPDKGEDVITATQSLASHLCTCLLRGAEPQISAAYLSFLTTLYFESPRAVNDFLADGSALLGALVTTASLTRDSSTLGTGAIALLPGLCATLLGVTYEFSSKDSPIPRRTLEPFLVGKLGRQRYFDALLQLRRHPAVRDPGMFDTLDIERDPVSLDPLFVDWFRDEYGRLRRVIDRDPGLEMLGRNHAGVDRDVLDDLRGQIASRDEAIQESEQQKLQAIQTADQLEVDHRKELQSLQSSQRNMSGELDAIKRINQSLQKDHQLEITRLKQEASSELERTLKSHKTMLEAIRQQHERELERLKGEHGASLASERSLWESKMQRASELAARDSAAKIEELKQSLQNRDNDLVVVRQEYQDANKKLQQSQDDLQSQAQALEQLQVDLQKSKDLQAGLQQVNTKALARSKAVEEENTRTEARCKALAQERDRLSEDAAKRASNETELRQEVESLTSQLAIERKGYGELEREHESIKTDLEASRQQIDKSDKSVGALKKTLDETNAALETSNRSLGELKNSHDQTIKSLNQTKKSLEESKRSKKNHTGKSESSKEVTEHSEAVSKLEADLSSKIRELTERNEIVKNLEGDISSKVAIIESEKSETQKARTELEDMLMVMADIESKRDEYKTRLKDAGQTVSEDEDEDDADDDDDDDAD